MLVLLEVHTRGSFDPLRRMARGCGGGSGVVSGGISRPGNHQYVFPAIPVFSGVYLDKPAPRILFTGNINASIFTEDAVTAIQAPQNERLGFSSIHIAILYALVLCWFMQHNS